MYVGAHYNGFNRVDTRFMVGYGFVEGRMATMCRTTMESHMAWLRVTFPAVRHAIVL